MIDSILGSKKDNAFSLCALIVSLYHIVLLSGHQMIDASSGPEIKIGTGKQNAVKAIIMGCTPASYKAMVTHMSLMSDIWL